MTLDEMLSKLGKRERTMRLALELLTARGGYRIVETGCAREAGNWSGDGMSTVVFDEYHQHNAKYFASIDNDQTHIEACRHLIVGGVDFRCGDSVAVLGAWQDQVDLLYLDSLDFPHGSLRDIYGGQADLEMADAILAEMTEAQVVQNHYGLIAPSQKHCAAELEAALPLLHPGSLVLIDDAGLPGGGKARLAKKLLVAEGWECLAEGYQTLWSKR
jgi:hypothetical protein